MNPIIIILILACVGGITLLSSDFLTNKDPRKRHLEALINLLDAKISQIESRPNCFCLEFEYRHQQFSYEDIEDTISNKTQYRGYLKLQTPLNLTLSFTERLRTQIRSIAPVFGDVSHEDDNWRASAVQLPANLKEFSAFSNMPDLASRLFADDAVARIFGKYKNRDQRGKPSLSLEIVDGIVFLCFYPPGEQSPAISDLRNNVPLIQNYLEDLLIVSACMFRLKEDKNS